jgi:hypothetical protein
LPAQAAIVSAPIPTSNFVEYLRSRGSAIHRDIPGQKNAAQRLYDKKSGYRKLEVDRQGTQSRKQPRRCLYLRDLRLSM